MDPLLNCLMAVCCPPEAQEDALTKFFVEYGGMVETHARKAAKCTLAHFDLAEKGTLQAFKDSIARLARGENYKG